MKKELSLSRQREIWLATEPDLRTDTRLRLFGALTVDKFGCWMRDTCCTPTGYTYIRVRSKTLGAHRAAWTVENGLIPDGMEIDHLCKNRGCINPAHLRIVTPFENRSWTDHPNTRKTHCKHGHAFTPENTQMNAGHRCCRTCGRAASARYKARKAAGV